MHPGPMNRGVEIAVDPAELPGAVITKQVSNGVAVRMAVLFDLLGVRDSRVTLAHLAAGPSSIATGSDAPTSSSTATSSPPSA